jgi:hypothetical protein
MANFTYFLHYITINLLYIFLGKIFLRCATSYWKGKNLKDILLISVEKRNIFLTVQIIYKSLFVTILQYEHSTVMISLTCVMSILCH